MIRHRPIWQARLYDLFKLIVAILLLLLLIFWFRRPGENGPGTNRETEATRAAAGITITPTGVDTAGGSGETTSPATASAATATARPTGTAGPGPSLSPTPEPAVTSGAAAAEETSQDQASGPTATAAQAATAQPSPSPTPEPALPAGTPTPAATATPSGPTATAAQATTAQPSPSPTSQAATSPEATATTGADGQNVTAPTVTLADSSVLTTPGVLVLTGTGEPGSRVEIVVDGRVIGQAPVASDGTWSYEMTGTPRPEPYLISVRSINETGEVLAESEPVPLTMAPLEPAGDGANGVSEGGQTGSGQGAGESQEDQVYIVQADDWLSKLALKFYGDPLAYPAIVEATNAKARENSSFATITNPDVIEIGQKLWIPASLPGS